MAKFLTLGLIILELLALVYIVNIICDAVKEYRLYIKNGGLNMLKRRIESLEDNELENTKKIDKIFF